MNNLTPRQMINVELATRASNKHSSSILKHHTPLQQQANLKISFNCECSDPDCQERILLTLKDYEKLHKAIARFVIAKGHEEPKIEKVKRNDKNLSVVDKYALLAR